MSDKKEKPAAYIRVQNAHGQSLPPCTPREARMLLESGMASAVKKNPFTIRLDFMTDREIELGGKPGEGDAVGMLVNGRLFEAVVLEASDDGQHLVLGRLADKTKELIEARDSAKESGE